MPPFRRTPISYWPYRYSPSDKRSLASHSKQSCVLPPPACPNPYGALLAEVGIALSAQDLGSLWSPLEIPASESILPSMPVGWSVEGVPQFTTTQLSWAAPEDFGFDEYEILERPPPFALSWAEEISCPKRRPTHKYSRFDRFRSVLNQLMLGCGDLPLHLLAQIPALDSEGDMWEQLRCILKAAGLRKYYNRIPGILCSMGYCTLFGSSSAKAYDAILADFTTLSATFTASKVCLKRIYFPNLRYICTRLMERHGVRLPLVIPRARTSKKRAALDLTFDHMWLLAYDIEPEEF